jgi:hypothetical protein
MSLCSACNERPAKVKGMCLRCYQKHRAVAWAAEQEEERRKVMAMTPEEMKKKLEETRELIQGRIERLNAELEIEQKHVGSIDLILQEAAAGKVILTFQGMTDRRDEARKEQELAQKEVQAHQLLLEVYEAKAERLKDAPRQGRRRRRTSR